MGEGEHDGGVSEPEPDVDPRATLLRLRESLAAELEATHQALLDIRRLRSDRSDDDEHDPEGAPLSGEWSRLDGRHRAAQQRVRDVDDALANVDAGRYGVCTRCGAAIAPGRLEIMPTATRCVRCAGKT
jgi:DnaK suppressor protein